jgi:segregation and condensation protein A
LGLAVSIFTGYDVRATENSILRKTRGLSNRMADITKTAQDLPIQEEFIVDEAADEILRVQLNRFEGPLEVLLYLIKSQEIDIFDIPIVKITDQYLSFLELMEEQNLDVAGEYLVMAATLIQIKSKMILPVDMDEEEEEIDGEDPRLELVEKLIAYRKYRDITSTLQEMDE